MNTQYARIIIHQHEIARGRHYQTYEWDGSPYWPVRVDAYEAQEWLNSYPWPLHKISTDPFGGDYATYMRLDILGGWWARGYVARRLAVQSLKWFHCRLVMTAMVWGFAFVPIYEEPQWKHLKWPRNKS
jgi:hypothetical protein